ncbi:MAG TPA: VOC family protein [Candidatus Limnocylindrales bacterium]
MSRYFDAFPIVYTADLPRALAFYRDLLGLRVTYAFPPEGEPEFAGLEGLALAAVTEGQTGAHGRPIAPGTRGFELCIYTDDVDRAVEELRARGVAVLVEPVDQPWGERMAYVADPDDHPVMICARLSDATPDVGGGLDDQA